MGEALSMPNARPMPSVSSGVSELRVTGEDGIFRVFYFAASPKGVELARQRLKELLDG
jgi:phage-related protein